MKSAPAPTVAVADAPAPSAPSAPAPSAPSAPAPAADARGVKRHAEYGCYKTFKARGDIVITVFEDGPARLMFQGF